jgi:ATP-dependent Clp protease ATP-binding subunit ClpC
LVEYIAKQGYDEQYGARPLRRVLQSKVEDMVSEKILSGEVKAPGSMTIDFADGEITINRENS